jgi:colanic acid/amylovoran biosynthesis glycosyltransferase
VSDEPRLAYLVSQYPAISHTFVQREVAGLRDLGLEVHTFSVRPAGPGDLRTAVDEAEARATTTLLPPSAATLLGVAATILRHPVAVAGVLRWALGRGGRDPKRTLWQAFYVIDAVLLWRQMRRAGLRHVHAHFANVAADVARLVVRLGRAVDGGHWTWSFTMHGPTELGDVTRFDLAAKAADADLVACISDFCRSQLMALTPESAWSRFAVVHCGVDVERFSPGPTPEPGPLRVLCVGRLVPEKGQAVLLEAAARLVDDGIDVEVVLAGDGPSRPALEAAAAPLGRRVRFLGGVGQDEIVDLYRSTDVFCLPSFAEGVPVVLMEAMACERPVVTTRIAGIPELVDDGVSGLVLAPGRADLLADALAALAKDPEERARLGRAGRDKVTAQFRTSSTAAELAEHFRQMLGTDRSSSEQASASSRRR